MNLYDCNLYENEISRVAQLSLPWNKLRHKTVLLAGATGMIGSFLIDVLMQRNRITDLNCHIIAISRDGKKATSRFKPYRGSPLLSLISVDVAQLLPSDLPPADYVIQAASNTHPLAYAQDPIGTLDTNVTGTRQLLQYATSCNARFLFLSSVEVYGQALSTQDRFSETDFGYLDCNTARSCYSEGKRVGEAFCQAFISQKSLDAVILRLPRVYGCTMQWSDSKAISQFLKCGILGQSIILKSAGTQYYSFLYEADAVSALLWSLLLGRCGEAYNAADARSDITLKDLADLIAWLCHTNVNYALPENLECQGYSKSTHAILNAEKLRMLGWQAEDSIESGLVKTLNILSWVYTIH